MELGAGMGVTVTRGMFGKDDGQIQWYGIIATINMTRKFWAWKGQRERGCVGKGRGECGCAGKGRGERGCAGKGQGEHGCAGTGR